MLVLRFIIGIIILFLLLYIACYFFTPKDFMVNQVSTEDFQFSLLYEKHPIVINNPIVDILEIINNWFNFNIVKETTIEKSKIWERINSKYLMIQSKVDSEIMISRPQSNIINGYPTNDILCIKLKENQVSIIPYRWYIMLNTEEHTYYNIDDYVTLFLGYFFFG